MDLVSKFAESLKELMFYRQEQTTEQLVKETGISRATINMWRSGDANYLPSLASVILLADYYKCSVDFLIGLENENYNPNPKPCPPFSERFKVAVKSRGFSLNKLSKVINMGSGNFYRWIRGEREPSLDSLVRIAKALDCTVDYLLGRGD